MKQPYNTTIRSTALYLRLSRGGELQGENDSIQTQGLLCRGWFLPPDTYDCGSFVMSGAVTVGRGAKNLITATNQHKKELIYIKSIFEQMGGIYRQKGDYLTSNLALPEEPEYQIGKYGRIRRSYLKEHRPVFYVNLFASGALHRYLVGIDQACNECMEVIVSDMAEQKNVTEAPEAANQMEQVRRILMTLLMVSLCDLIRTCGGFESILAFICQVFHSKRDDRLGVGLPVGLIGIATANNTVAIVIAGLTAKEVEEECGISPKHSASQLDTFSCIFQGIIPYGVQVLIAISTYATLSYAISAFGIIPLLFYPFLLCLSSLLFILFDRK